MMTLQYNGIQLASLGTLRILGRLTDREPAEAPQRERVTYRMRLDFFEQSFASNFTQVQQFLSALKTQNAALLWQDGNGSTYETRTVIAGSDSLPEDVMSRGGTYWQSVVFTFWYYNHDVAGNCLAASCLGLDLGAVERWREGAAETRYDELRDPRKRVEGTVAASGRYQADTTGPLATRQAALLALKDQMLATLTPAASGNLNFGTFNRNVRIVAFSAEVDQPANYIAWSLTVTFTLYPNEADYALLDFRLQTKLSKPENILHYLLAGTIHGPTETAARARLALLTGSLIPPGAAQILNDTTATTMGSESNAVTSGNPGAGDGTVFTALAFNLEYRDTSTVTCTWQRAGVNTPLLDLGVVDKFTNRTSTTLFDEMRDQRRREAGQVTIGGRWYVSDALSAADQQTALTNREQQLQSELQNGAAGQLIYGGVLNQRVRVLDFAPEINRFSNCLEWSLTASYTAFPNEADYALCEFKLATRQALTEGTIFKTLTGEIWAPTPGAAQSKLARLRSVLIPAGYTMVKDNTDENRVDVESSLQTTGVNSGEGPTFLRLTIDEEWQATAAGNVLKWNLNVATNDDARTAFVTTTYTGQVLATGVDQPTAFASALAQAQALGNGMLPFQLRSAVTENEKLFQTTGAMVFVTVDFSYEYLGKSATTYLQVTSELSADTFGMTTETVSGYVAAPSLAAAQASYIANVRAAATNLGALVLAEKTPTKSYQGFTAAGATTPVTLDDRYTFSLQLLRAKDITQTAINYSLATACNVQALEVTTVIEGTIYASTEAVARAFLDTFLGTQALPGKRTAYDRVPEYRQGPAIGGSAPTSVFLAIKFRDTYLSLLTGVAGILQTEVTEAVQYSGTRNIEKGLPTGNSIIQQVGIVAGRRTVTCKAVSTTPTAAQAWIRTIRNALLLSAQSTPGAYEEPARVQTQYLFLPQISGVVTGANVNVKLYEVTGTFSEILPDYGFTP